MSNKNLTVARWELVVAILIANLIGYFMGATGCGGRPAHAMSMDGTPGISESANRMACALEGIQHTLEHWKH